MPAQPQSPLEKLVDEKASQMPPFLLAPLVITTLLLFLFTFALDCRHLLSMQKVIITLLSIQVILFYTYRYLLQNFFWQTLVYLSFKGVGYGANLSSSMLATTKKFIFTTVVVYWVEQVMEIFSPPSFCGWLIFRVGGLSFFFILMILRLIFDLFYQGLVTLVYSRELNLPLQDYKNVLLTIKIIVNSTQDFFLACLFWGFGFYLRHKLTKNTAARREFYYEEAKKEMEQQKNFATFQGDDEENNIKSPTSPSDDSLKSPTSPTSPTTTSATPKKKSKRKHKKEIMFIELPKAMRIYFRAVTFCSICFGSYLLLGTTLKVIEYLFKITGTPLNNASDAVFVVVELFFFDELPLWACLVFAFPTVDYSCFNTSRQSRILSVQQNGNEETSSNSNFSRGGKKKKKHEKVSIYDFAVNGLVLFFLLWEFARYFLFRKKKHDIGVFDTEIPFKDLGSTFGKNKLGPNSRTNDEIVPLSEN